MKKRKTYYQILHVQQDAPLEVIRSSYRTMMQKLKMHPDLGGDEENAAMINQAYAVLANPSTRAEYDTSLEMVVQQTESEPFTDQQAKKKSYYAKQNDQAIDTTNICAFCKSTHNLGDKVLPESLCSICNSTLYPAVKQAYENCGQRIISRIDKQWPVTFSLNWPEIETYTGQTQDVSLNGMQILCNIALDVGQIIKIDSNSLDAVARVVNLREDFNSTGKQWRIGLEFLTLQFHSAHGTFVRLDI